VRRVDPSDEILMTSRAGLTVRFSEKDARGMGRDTSGVRGMDVSGEDNRVIAMDVARPGQDLLVVTENGFGKRTSIDEYRLTSRGAKGVKTIQQTEVKGALAGALVVREHQELVFISRDGMVQRTSVRGINRYGRAAQGVRLMNLREEDVVSAVALVVEPEAAAAAPSVDATAGPATLSADGGDDSLDMSVGDGVLAVDPDDEPADDEPADDDGGSEDDAS
jgi:DNA gyrase subunit A